MQLTHEEAIQLIQYKTDKTMPGAQEMLLHAHLKDCAQCHAYASEFKEMENILQRVMQKHWSKRPAPFSIRNLKAEKRLQKNKSVLLVTRRAFVGIAVMAFFFFGWQATLTNTSGQNIYPGLLPIPTPSTQYTATTSFSLHCQEILYKVQQNDTLQSIADQHITSKEVIAKLNNLNIEDVQLGMELLIPACELTPTSTLNPPTFTITPILELTTYTPG